MSNRHQMSSANKLLAFGVAFYCLFNILITLSLFPSVLTISMMFLSFVGGCIGTFVIVPCLMDKIDSDYNWMLVLGCSVALLAVSALDLWCLFSAGYAV